MPESTPAVFLSYASQDAEAARRIAEALRAADIEVWFDEAELGGGDAWDRKIKQQIRECALFIPVVSANTEARLEGYFRREWRIAVDRMADMDDALPFLVPIVIDDTDDATARVPDRFRERQWTHLPGGETTPAFVERLATLLAADTATPPPPPERTAGAARIRRDKPGALPTWLMACIVVVGVGTGLYYAVGLPLLHRSGDDAPTPPLAPALATPPISDERPYIIGTLAVLPPQVIVRTPESTAFAESLQEELLTELNRLRSFELVAQSAASPPNADFMVETSLQLDGAERRVTLRIIEAATNRHIAAETFSRTPDATVNAALLRKELAWDMAIRIYRDLREERPPSPASQARLDQVVAKLTAEADALRVRFWGDDGDPPDPSLYERLMELTRETLAIVPDHPQALTDHGSFLGHAAFVGRANFFDDNWRQSTLLSLRRAAANNPTSVAAQRNLGNYYLTTEGQPSLSLPYLQDAVRLADADAPYANNWPYYQLASALHQTGQSVAALRVLERAPHDPAIDQLSYWTDPFIATRRFGDALDFLRHHAPRLSAADAGGSALTIDHLITDMEVRWSGDREALRPFVARLDNDPFATAGMRCRYHLAIGDYAGVLQEMAAVEPGRDPYAPNPIEMALYRGLALARTGNETLAHSFFRSVLSRFTTGPEAEMMLQRVPGIVHSSSAFMHAGLGQIDEMHTSIEAARASTDPGRNLQGYLQAEYLIALAYAEAGAVTEACATINQLLSTPSTESTGSVLANVSFDQLHDTPEFQTLIGRHQDQLQDPAILDRLFAE